MRGAVRFYSALTAGHSSRPAETGKTMPQRACALLEGCAGQASGRRGPLTARPTCSSNPGAQPGRRRRPNRRHRTIKARRAPAAAAAAFIPHALRWYEPPRAAADNRDVERPCLRASSAPGPARLPAPLPSRPAPAKRLTVAGRVSRGHGPVRRRSRAVISAATHVFDPCRRPRLPLRQAGAVGLSHGRPRNVIPVIKRYSEGSVGGRS